MSHEEKYYTKIIGDSKCPSCSSNGGDKTGNHLIHFDNGGAYCNRCRYHEPSGTHTEPEKKFKLELSAEECKLAVTEATHNSKFSGIGDRKINLNTAKHFGVKTQVSEKDGRTPIAWLFPSTLPESNEIQGFKVRYAGKKIFSKIGNVKGSSFFGANVCPKRGKKIFITEGELDALALYQVMHDNCLEGMIKRIAVVSLASGSAGAAREMALNKNLLQGFEDVVLVFDQDKAGRKAAEDAGKVVDRSKLRVVKFEENDPCDMLIKGKGRDLYFDCIMTNKNPCPETIMAMDDITLEELLTPLKKGLELPYPKLSKMLGGLRYGEGGGELSVFCAGSGMGKTTLAREIMYDINKNYDLRIGHIFLEEQYRKTSQSYIAIDNNVPIAKLRVDPGCIPKEAFAKSYKELIACGRHQITKHFGSLASDSLMDQMTYFAHGCKCSIIALDHISMVVSGQTSSGPGGERKDLDILMTKLAAFCEDTGVSVIAIVHLRRPSQGSFNDGTKIALNHLRGSAAIEQLSHNIIAIEGDQQGEDKNIRTIRVLKNREWGNVGEADTLEYNPETGRLLPKVMVEFSSKSGGY